jgi:hypothetical protein
MIGMRNSPEYRAWRSMKQRCFNPKCRSYRDYGARGITVCERWLVFENFYADMGSRPADMSLERDRNSGNYEPGNCRWATRTEQQRNTRQNKLLTYAGETHCTAEWALRTGIAHNTIYARLKRGWSHERALTTPT